jgi:hypothetical protein
VTRKEFEKTFVHDGGLSTLSAERYCFRDCPYIKVDVAFSVAEGSKSAKSAFIDPDAKLITISKPYLETPFGD